MKIKVAALALACALPLHAQLTQTHAPSTVVQSNVMAPGINLGTINYYNDGQVLKNIVGAINPGFEPALSQQIQVVNTTGTSSSWTDPNKYAIVPANYWAGGTATVVHSQSGNTTGCSSTIASNTGPNYPTETNTAAVYTLSAPCAGAFSTGDTIVIKRHLASTPETQMESSAGGFWSNISSGGKLLGETTDLCATCGQQALDMQAASGTAAATFYWDTSPAQNLFRLLNGTYVISYDAKAASGSPTLSVSASRPGTNAFSSGTFTPSLTSSWQHFTHTFTASEVGIWSGNSNCVAGGVTTACTTQTAGQNARLVLSATGGEVYLDNVSLAPASSTNPTIFTDNFVAALTNLHPGTLRYWLGQNGEDAANWLAPDYARSPSGPGFWVGPVSIGNVTYPSLQDFLALAQTVGAQPYVEIPVTISNSDAACVVEFLAAATAGCAANRIALGQSTPWTSIFSNIHLAYCNECWNGSFAQQNLQVMAVKYIVTQY